MGLREQLSGGKTLAYAVLVLASALAPSGCEPRRSEYVDRAKVILRNSLRDDRASIRDLAITTHRELGIDIPEPELSVLLGDPQAPGRFSAVLAKAEQRGLTSVARRKARLYLAKVYREDEDPSVRLAAVYGLALRGDTRYIEALARALNSHRAGLGERRVAAKLLGLLGNKSAVPMLKRHLNDPDGVVRLNVAEAMAQLGSNAGLSEIRKLIVGSKSRLQGYAILALGRVGIRPKDIQFLRQEFGNARRCSLEARLASYGSRAMLGDYAQMPTLEEIVMTPHGGGSPLEARDRAFILQLLARSAYGLAWQEAGTCLSESDQQIRLSAAWATLAFDTPRGQQLKGTISDSSAEERGVREMTAGEILRERRQRLRETGSGESSADGPRDPLGRQAPRGPERPVELRK